MNYPSYVVTETEKIFWDRLTRQDECILRMQKRIASIPILSFIWRQPWRSKAPTGWKEGKTLRVKVQNIISWLRHAHNCADPAVGCSCHGSFRFPKNGAE